MALNTSTTSSPNDVVAYLYTDESCPPHPAKLVRRGDIDQGAGCFVTQYAAGILLIHGKFFEKGACASSAQPPAQINRCFAFPDSSPITGVSVGG